MVIPFPEAEQYLPPIVAEKPADPPEIEKPKTAPKGTAKKSRA